MLDLSIGILGEHGEASPAVTTALALYGVEISHVHPQMPVSALADYDAFIQISSTRTTEINRAQSVRAITSAPIILVTIADSRSIVGEALRAGFDDCLLYPFTPEELVERLHLALDRLRVPSKRSAIQIGSWRFCYASHTISAAKTNAVIKLTAREALTLKLLLAAAGSPVTRDALFEQCTGRALNPTDRSVDVHVSALRRKLHTGGIDELRISSIRNRGYAAVILTPPRQASDNRGAAYTSLPMTVNGRQDISPKAWDAATAKVLLEYEAALRLKDRRIAELEAERQSLLADNDRLLEQLSTSLGIALSHHRTAHDERNLVALTDKDDLRRRKKTYLKLVRR